MRTFLLVFLALFATSCWAPPVIGAVVAAAAAGTAELLAGAAIPAIFAAMTAAIPSVLVMRSAKPQSRDPESSEGNHEHH